MGKRSKTEYNDFLDGEKLRDNAEIRTSLQGTQTLTRNVSPPQTRRHTTARGKKSKGGLKKPQLTHFLCVPLVNDHSRPQLETKLSELKQELRGSGFLPVKAVRPPGTLHLTLGVMSLDDEQLDLATQYLSELDVQKMLQNVTAQCLAEEAAASGTVSENLNAFAMPDWEALSIDLKGLVPMQAPQKTSILYAEPVDKRQILQPFGEKLRYEFTQKGFLIEDKRTLRLHATVINTIYAKSKGRGGRANAKPSQHRTGEGSVDGVNGVEEHDDGASMAGSSIDGHDEVTTAPPDPSTIETKVPKLDGSTGHGPEAKSWLRFDARDLIERYKDVVWAENVRIDRVQICKMGAKKILDGEGEVVAEEYEVVGEKVIGA
jgi:activating signal cointegrator complex subunit 1